MGISNWELDQRNSGKPNVHPDGYAGPLESVWAIHRGQNVYGQSYLRGEYPKGSSTHVHVSRGTEGSVGNWVGQPSRHSKITYFNLPSGVEEDVGGLDICRVV